MPKSTPLQHNSENKKDNFNAMCKGIAEYIKIHGGNVVIIGGIGISKRPPFKYNYTLHIDFSGRPPKKVK